MSAALIVSTLIAPAGSVLTHHQIDDVAQSIAASGASIEKIIPLDSNRAADIFYFSHKGLAIIPSPLAGAAEGSRVGSADPGHVFPFDILTQSAATRRKKILIADMEATIIEQEMLDELAAEIGIGEKVADITRRAMNGELDFTAALTERVALLKGQPESLLTKLASRMTVMPGAQQLVAAMKQSGAHCWLVSGGFTCFVKIIAEQLGFDRFYANDLVVENDVLTGQVRLPILDKSSKTHFLKQACHEYGCALINTLAVGDGANDIPMLQACHEGGGLGIAYHAKPKVRGLIPNQINCSDHSALIYATALA
jgi:phosphoserine phosphatase